MPDFKDQCSAVVFAAAAGREPHLLLYSQRSSISLTACRCSFLQTFGLSVPLSSHLYMRSQHFGRGCDGPCVTDCGVLRKEVLRHCPMDCTFLFNYLVLQPQSICENYEGKCSLRTSQRLDELFWQG